MNAFLLIYDDKCGTEEAILRHIDNVKEVVNWNTGLPNTVFIISDSDSYELTELFTPHFNKGMFLVARIDDEDINGLLPEDTWDFINNPEPA